MMAFQKKPIGHAVRAVHIYGILAAFYTLLIFVLPANPQITHDHNLTAPEYHVFLFAINLPLLIVWFVAFYGYSKLQEYAHSIQKAPESNGFGPLATGCAWLAWSLPASAITAIVLDSIASKNPGFHAAAVIITNYVNLLFPLIAFSLVGIASRSFFNQAKMNFSIASMRGIMLIFVTAGVLYCYLIFRHFDTASLGSTDNSYFLPIWVMVLTVIVPYLYAWFIGLLAAYEITAYSRRVKGVLYRQALHLMVGGIVSVIIASIAQQYVSSIVPAEGHLLLNYRLVLTILFRIISGVGFVLIALGAIRLKKIEEV